MPLGHRSWKWAVTLCIAVGPLASPAAARADDSPSAQDLFTAAKTDMDAGRYDAACPAFLRSYRMAPLPVTLFHLAACEDKAGLVASASAHYREYIQSYDRLSASEQKDQRSLEETAAARGKALEPSVPQLTFVLPPSAPFGTKILRKTANGAAVEIPAGVAVPIDPGEHVATTETPGGKVREQRFTVKLGEKRTLVAEVEPGPNEPPPPRYAAEVPPVPVTLPPEEKPRSSLRKAALIIGGAGIAGLAIGIAGGAVVLSQKSTIDGNCVDRYCNRTGQSAADTAHAGGIVANVAFPFGIALLAAGGALYLAEPPPPKLAGAPSKIGLRLSLNPAGATLGAEGAF